MSWDLFHIFQESLGGKLFKNERLWLLQFVIPAKAGTQTGQFCFSLFQDIFCFKYKKKNLNLGPRLRGDDTERAARLGIFMSDECKIRAKHLLCYLREAVRNPTQKEITFTRPEYGTKKANCQIYFTPPGPRWLLSTQSGRPDPGE